MSNSGLEALPLLASHVMKGQRGDALEDGAHPTGVVIITMLRCGLGVAVLLFVLGQELGAMKVISNAFGQTVRVPIREKKCRRYGRSQL